MNGNGALLVFLIFWAIQIGVGAWIGHSKGRTWTGLLLGTFLGVLGWVIIACLRPTYAELMRRERVAQNVREDVAAGK